MEKTFVSALLFFVFVSACRSVVSTDELRLYDLDGGRILTGQEAIEPLRRARLIVVGEHHASKDHHQAQLAVIQALNRSGRPLAIGLEMFRQESQADLNRWVADQTPEPDFEAVYLDNWNFDWSLYRPIFEYAREQDLPMVGLNVPRSVSRQVAQHGFESLSEEQKGGLNAVTCDVTARYREFIAKAYGAHAHAAMPFENFCEAQLLWDTAMAKRALDYLEEHPDRSLVLLSGSGHARRPAIPSQVRKKSDLPMVIILPQTKGVFEPDITTSADADYLIITY